MSSLNYLNYYHTYQGLIKKIKIPNGKLLTVTHIGSVRLSTNITLKDVLYALSLCFNLIYISQLTADSSCIVSFHPKFCAIQDIKTRKIMEIGKLHVVLVED